MKPIEIKLNNQYKALAKELEDYWCMEGNDKISDTADKLVREKYFQVQDLAKEICDLCSSKEFTPNKCNDQVRNFRNTIMDLKEYLYSEEIKGFKKEIFDSVGEKSKQIVDEIKYIEATAYHYNLQKLANTIHFRTWKNITNITYILNHILGEIIPAYEELLNVEIKKVDDILNAKEEELNPLVQANGTELGKAYTKKIFDYKEMDSLVREKGYEPIRQTGSHLIYSNGVNSVPVPQHDLGLGLSVKIQKQVQV